jgi:hypothetical protein
MHTALVTAQSTKLKQEDEPWEINANARHGTPHQRDVFLPLSRDSQRETTVHINLVTANIA